MADRPTSVRVEPTLPSHPAPVAATGEQSWAELGPAVRALVRVARAAGVDVDDEGPARSVEELALLRMIAGGASGGDYALLPVPLPGARIACTVAADAAVTTRAVTVLRAERGCFTVRVSDVEAVTVVRNSPRRAGEDRALTECRAIAARLVRLGGVRVGVSAPVSTPADVASAYRDARDLTRMTTELPVAVAEDHWADITLSRLTDHVVESLSAASPLARLADYDATSGNALARTVAVWLAHDRDTAKTAAALDVHVNTLRYRLRRAGEVSGLALDDRRQRLVLELLLAAGAP